MKVTVIEESSIYPALFGIGLSYSITSGKDFSAFSCHDKERLLGVDHQLLEEKTAVCQEVAEAMVRGAIKTLNVDLAVVSTGVAGPGGGTPQTPVGTIWIACGNAENIVTLKLTEDYGRDINLAIATTKAMQLFLNYLNDNMATLCPQKGE